MNAMKRKNKVSARGLLCACLCAVVIICGAAVWGISSAAGNEECVHEYDAGTVYTQATCTAKGKTKYICTKCQDEKIVENIPALGHDISATPTIDVLPDCTHTGTGSYHCSRCNYTERAYEISPMHTLGPATVVTAPTCISTGLSMKQCTRCPYFEQKTLDTVDHSYVKTTCTATCTEAGTQSYKCSVCNAEKTENTGMLGHDYSTEYTVDITPTCSALGSKSRHCTRCDDKADITPIEKIPHSYLASTVLPRCLVSGYTLHKCSMCRDEYRDNTTPPLGHDFSEEFTIDKSATCAAPGEKSRHCSRCDEVAEKTVIPPNAHTWETLDVPATCIAHGYSQTSCTVCGFVSSRNEKDDEFADHSWVVESYITVPTCIATGTAHYKCSVDGCSATKDDVTPTAEHTYAGVVTAPTCTAKGYTTFTCSVCSDSYVGDETEMIPHSWDAGTVTREPVCSAVGEKTFTCTVCGATKTEDIERTAHIDTVKLVDPTCTEKGYVLHTCTICNEKWKSNYTNALGHQTGTTPKVVNSSCTEGGYVSYRCERCGEDVVDPKTVGQPLGHELGKGVVISEISCTTDKDVVYTCSVCGETVHKITKARGHSYGRWAVDTPVSVLGEGLKVRVCSECGAEDLLPMPKPETAQLTDEATGITVIWNKTLIPGEVTLKVEDLTLTHGDIPTLPTAFIEGIFSVKLYENGTEIPAGTEYAVILPYDILRKNDITVFTLDSVGNPAKKELAETMDYIAFLTKTFGSFAVLDYSSVVPGDANGDGKVKAADARLVLRHAAGLEVLSPEAIYACDFDSDGKLKSSEARKILRMAAGLD